MRRGGLFPLYSDDLSSNPAEALSFYVKGLFENN